MRMPVLDKIKADRSRPKSAGSFVDIGLNDGISAVSTGHLYLATENLLGALVRVAEKKSGAGGSHGGARQATLAT